MYGLLGGLLELVNILGGIVLWCLIGRPAWKKNATARWSRILIGSIPSGSLGGIVVVLLLYTFGTVPETSAVFGVGIALSFCGVLLVAAIASGLEALRKTIERDRGDDVQH